MVVLAVLYIWREEASHRWSSKKDMTPIRPAEALNFTIRRLCKCSQCHVNAAIALQFAHVRIG